jgi:hypothetical protein
MVAYSIGSYFVQMPVLDRKSGMPLSVETPAPVRTTHGCAPTISLARCSMEMPELYARLAVGLAALAVAAPPRSGRGGRHPSALAARARVVLDTLRVARR